MAATTDFPSGFKAFDRRKLELGANVKAIKGTEACVATTGANKGYVVPMSATPGLRPLGRFGETVDNTGGALGAKKAEVLFHRHIECLKLLNDNVAPLSKADRGGFCYGKDNNTVSAASDGRSAAGVFWDLEDGYALVEPAPAMSAPETTGQLLKKSVTIPFNHASFLAEGDDGDAVDINVGSALPDGAVLVGRRYTIVTPFAGAGLATLTMMVGFAGDTNGVIEAVDVLSDVAGEYAGVAGTAMGGPAGGKQLVANFDPDAAAGLDELTAGELTIDVFYIVMP